MWEELDADTKEAAAELKKRLEALGDEASATVAALNLPHNTSNPCWETWCVYVCLV